MAFDRLSPIDASYRLEVAVGRVCQLVYNLALQMNSDPSKTKPKMAEITDFIPEWDSFECDVAPFTKMSQSEMLENLRAFIPNLSKSAKKQKRNKHDRPLSERNTALKHTSKAVNDKEG